MDEFTAIPGPTSVNGPITGLAASNSSYAYPYFPEYGTMCAYGGSDTITLSCADPTAGSALQTVTLTLSPAQIAAGCP
jgi:hypothetical protein